MKPLEAWKVFSLATWLCTHVYISMILSEKKSARSHAKNGHDSELPAERAWRRAHSCLLQTPDSRDAVQFYIADPTGLEAAKYIDRGHIGS